MHGATIDWKGLKERLAGAERTIAEGAVHTPEQVRGILESRARAAARPPTRLEEEESLEVLTFSLAGETYAVEIDWVREVCQLRDLTPLPCTPPYVAGVMNLRGRILAVVDLRKLFALPARGLTELNRVIVLAQGESELGLLADSIERVRAVKRSELQDGLPTLQGIREKFLKGVTGQMLAVLDGGRLLADACPKGDVQEPGQPSQPTYGGKA